MLKGISRAVVTGRSVGDVQLTSRHLVVRNIPMSAPLPACYSGSSNPFSRMNFVPARSFFVGLFCPMNVVKGSAWAVGLLLIVYCFLIFLVDSVKGNPKLAIGVTAGFVVLAEGIIDLCKDHSSESTFRLDIIKLLYRFVGVVAAVLAVLAEKSS